MHKSHLQDPQTYLCDFIAISQLIKFPDDIIDVRHTTVA